MLQKATMVVCWRADLHTGTLGVRSHSTAQTNQMLHGEWKSKPSSFTALSLVHAPQEEEGGALLWDAVAFIEAVITIMLLMQQVSCCRKTAIKTLMCFIFIQYLIHDAAPPTWLITKKNDFLKFHDKKWPCCRGKRWMAVLYLVLNLHSEYSGYGSFIT